MVLFFLSRIRWRFVVLGVLLPILVRAAEPSGVVNVDGVIALYPVLPVDTDGDGVADEQDLCPNTPSGTPVNTYGCPKTLASCDYTTSSITLTSAGGAGGGTVRYVLADSLGTILQVSATTSFSGLSGSHTYMALSISHDGSATGLSVGQSLSSVTASCYDWSTALVIKVCVATTPPQPTCDYTIGATITLKSTGGSTTVGTLVRYALVNTAGTIVRVASTPVFSTLGLAPGAYKAYSLVYTDDASITNLQTGSAFATLTATCISISGPLSLVLCLDCKPICVPILITLIRQSKQPIR